MADIQASTVDTLELWYEPVLAVAELKSHEAGVQATIAALEAYKAEALQTLATQAAHEAGYHMHIHVCVC